MDKDGDGKDGDPHRDRITGTPSVPRHSGAKIPPATNTATVAVANKAAGDGWVELTDDMGLGDFDGKEILVGEDVYTATIYMPNPGEEAEVLVEEIGDDGLPFEGIPISDIEAIRETDDSDTEDASSSPTSQAGATSDGVVDEIDFETVEQYTHGTYPIGTDFRLEHVESGEVKAGRLVQTAEDHSSFVLANEEVVDLFNSVDSEWDVTGVEPDPPTETREFDADSESVIDYFDDGVQYLTAPGLDRLVEKTKEHGATFFERADDDVAEQALNHIKSITESVKNSNVVFAAGKKDDHAPVRFRPSSRKKTFDHEFGHLVAGVQNS